MGKTNDGPLLKQILGPVTSSLNHDAARRLIGLKADRETAAQVARLARKCNEGDLTAEERMEYETCVMAGEIVAILQAQAHIVLARESDEA
jgi:hypothetical protein